MSIFIHLMTNTTMNIDILTEKHQLHKSDTGSGPLQIIGLTARITHLTAHLKTHPKDFHSRRGLIAMTNKRRRLFEYINKHHPTQSVEISKDLGLKRKHVH